MADRDPGFAPRAGGAGNCAECAQIPGTPGENPKPRRVLSCNDRVGGIRAGLGSRAGVTQGFWGFLGPKSRGSEPFHNPTGVLGLGLGLNLRQGSELKPSSGTKAPGDPQGLCEPQRKGKKAKKQKGNPAWTRGQTIPPGIKSHPQPCPGGWAEFLLLEFSAEPP